MKKFVFLTILGSFLTIILVLAILYPENFRVSEIQKEITKFFKIAPSPTDESFQEWRNQNAGDPVARNMLSENEFTRYESEKFNFSYHRDWQVEKGKYTTLKSKNLSIEIRESTLKDSTPSSEIFEGLEISLEEFLKVSNLGEDFSKVLEKENTTLKLDSVNQFPNDVTSYVFKEVPTIVSSESLNSKNMLPNEINVFMNQNNIFIVKMVNSNTRLFEEQLVDKSRYEVFIERFEIK